MYFKNYGINIKGFGKLTKILYISNYWSGFSDLYENGQVSAAGMPGFLKPLEHIVQNGYTVEIIFLKEFRKEDVRCAWLKNIKIHFIDPKQFKIKILSKVKCLINKINPDFIYAQGSMPAFYASLANIGTRIPLAKRLYGTFLVEKLGNNFFSALIKYPYELIALNTPARFLLITNDGTKGDEVYRKFCYIKKSLPLFFWENGVDKKSAKIGQGKITSSNGQLDLVFPARYDRWKRQDRILLFASKLKAQGLRINVTFCGHIYDKKYFEELRCYAQDLDLEDDTRFLGPVPPTQLTNLIIQSDLVPFFYDFSNYGNVFIECSLLGALTVVLNDGSTDCFSKRDKVNILVKDEDDAVKQILHYIENASEISKIKKKCMDMAQQHYMSWNDRSLREISLIKQCI